MNILPSHHKKSFWNQIISRALRIVSVLFFPLLATLSLLSPHALAETALLRSLSAQHLQSGSSEEREIGAAQCYSIRANAFYRGYGYHHVVSVDNGCD